jgi:hypothetical protein
MSELFNGKNSEYTFKPNLILNFSLENNKMLMHHKPLPFMQIIRSAQGTSEEKLLGIIKILRIFRKLIP